MVRKEHLGEIINDFNVTMCRKSWKIRKNSII